MLTSLAVPCHRSSFLFPVACGLLVYEQIVGYQFLSVEKPGMLYILSVVNDTWTSNGVSWMLQAATRMCLFIHTLHWSNSMVSVLIIC